MDGWTTAPRSFRVASPGDYRSYRLLVTEDNNSGTGVQNVVINELLLEGVPPAISHTPASRMREALRGAEVGQKIRSRHYG